MIYINVGAIEPHTGNRILTKTALKRAAAEGQGSVAFDQTAFPQHAALPGIIEPNDVIATNNLRQSRGLEQIELSVVGPDPRNKRTWYASVRVGRDGTLKVA
jgi:hypothetical protein